MAHIRQPRPDSSLGFQVNVLEPFEGFPPGSNAGEVYGLGFGVQFFYIYF